MLFRKYLAFIESTFPWIWVCLLTWWIDRLFVELGHRSSDTVICTHSDIQYVKLHQYLTIVACVAQIMHSINRRKTQFKREARIMGIEDMPCQWFIYFGSIIVCSGWTCVIVCLIDVSPWLCIDTIVQNRASITLLSLLAIAVAVPIEAKIWDKTLQDTLQYQSGPIDI